MLTGGLSGRRVHNIPGFTIITQVITHNNNNTHQSIETAKKSKMGQIFCIRTLQMDDFGGFLF